MTTASVVCAIARAQSAKAEPVSHGDKTKLGDRRTRTTAARASGNQLIAGTGISEVTKRISHNRGETKIEMMSVPIACRLASGRETITPTIAGFRTREITCAYGTVSVTCQSTARHLRMSAGFHIATSTTPTTTSGARAPTPTGTTTSTVAIIAAAEPVEQQHRWNNPAAPSLA